jgi:hypothetical protein
MAKLVDQFGWQLVYADAGDHSMRRCNFLPDPGGPWKRKVVARTLLPPDRAYFDRVKARFTGVSLSYPQLRDNQVRPLGFAGWLRASGNSAL